MPAIWPVFVPKGSTAIYKVWVKGLPEAFEAPLRGVGRCSAGREAVHPFRDHSGKYVMTMYALSPEHCRYHEALRRGAAILEAQATRVFYTIFTHPCEDRDHLVALIMMAWYLADDDASIMQLPDDLDFSNTDTAVWAAVAAIRNMWALEAYLSRDALRKYLDCYYQFVDLLRLQDVRLYTSHHPVE
jgi:hypothetical protein